MSLLDVTLRFVSHGKTLSIEDNVDTTLSVYVYIHIYIYLCVNV